MEYSKHFSQIINTCWSVWHWHQLPADLTITLIQPTLSTIHIIINIGKKKKVHLLGTFYLETCNWPNQSCPQHQGRTSRKTHCLPLSPSPSSCQRMLLTWKRTWQLLHCLLRGPRSCWVHRSVRRDLVSWIFNGTFWYKCMNFQCHTFWYTHHIICYKEKCLVALIDENLYMYVINVKNQHKNKKNVKYSCLSILPSDNWEMFLLDH